MYVAIQKGLVLRKKFQFSSFYITLLLTPMKCALLHTHTYMQKYLHNCNFKDPGTRDLPAMVHLVYEY